MAQLATHHPARAGQPPPLGWQVPRFSSTPRPGLFLSLGLRGQEGDSLPPALPALLTIVSRLVIWFSVLSKSCSRYRFFLSSSLARLQREPTVTGSRVSPDRPPGPPQPRATRHPQPGRTHSFLPSRRSCRAISLSRSSCCVILFWYCFSLSRCCFSCCREHVSRQHRADTAPDPHLPGRRDPHGPGRPSRSHWKHVLKRRSCEVHLPPQGRGCPETFLAVTTEGAAGAWWEEPRGAAQHRSQPAPALTSITMALNALCEEGGCSGVKSGALPVPQSFSHLSTSLPPQL